MSLLKERHMAGFVFIFVPSFINTPIFFNLEIILYIVCEVDLYFSQNSFILLAYDIFPLMDVNATNCISLCVSFKLFIIDIIYTKQIDLKVEQSQGKLFRD